MRHVAVLCLLLISCGKVGLVSSLDPRCATPCYGGPAAKAGVGICTKGTWECQTDGGMTCAGWVAPSLPQCNGLDNDCNGVIDSPTQACYTGAEGTQNVGPCHGGNQLCIEGTWSACSGEVVPTAESCNGIDDDCDGTVDDNIPLTFCYNGPTNTVGVGICHPGVSACVDGDLVCTGEQTPGVELCNGLDDNCNGTIDEGTSPADVDVVFIVDYSGSMEIPWRTGQQSSVIKIKEAFTSDAQQFNATNYLYSLVAAPPPTAAQDKTYRLLITDAGAWDLDAVLDQETPANDFGSGQEPTLDALRDVCDTTDPLAIRWRSGSVHKLVLFSDEVPQSYYRLPDGGLPNPNRQPYTIRDFCVAQDPAVQLSVFTLPKGVQDGNFGYPYDWWSLAIPDGGGFVFDITQDSSVFAAELMNILSETSCHP